MEEKQLPGAGAATPLPSGHHGCLNLVATTSTTAAGATAIVGVAVLATISTPRIGPAAKGRGSSRSHVNVAVQSRPGPPWGRRCRSFSAG